MYRETITSWAAGQEAILRVTNGDSAGASRISSAVILFNGKPVFRPKDFNQRVGSLQATVTTRETNKLVVKMNGGGAGRHLSVELVLPFFEEVPGWRRPELAVADLSVSPERAGPGEMVSLCATVSSVGKGETPEARLLVSVDEANLLDEPIGSMEPGEETRACTTWQATGPGNHLVRAELEIDPEGVDYSTPNNVHLATARVSGAPVPVPELEFGEIDFGTIQLTPGSPAHIPLHVRNPGFEEIAFLVLDFYIDGVQVHSDIIENLAAGEEKVFQVPWSLVTPGEHTITVHTPSDDALPLVSLTRAWAFVVPDSTVLYHVIGKDKWVPVGPSILHNGWAGRMNSIAFNPDDPAEMYTTGLAGSFNIPSGSGVWKSTNGGGSWKPVGDKLPSMMVRDVAVDPTYPDDIVYAGAPDGIFKSVDGGDSWTWFAHKNQLKDVEKLIVRSSTSRVLVYAATKTGVYRYSSTSHYDQSSAAVGWDRIKQGVIHDLAIHPADDSTLFASVGGDGLYRTKVGENAREETTAGIHDWIKLTTGLPAINATRGLKVDIHPLYPNVIYAGVTNPSSGTRFALYRSFDSGDKWSMIRSYANQELEEHRNCSIYNPYIRVAPIALPGSGDYLTEVIYFGGQCLYQLVHYEPLVKNAKVSPASTHMVSGYHVQMRAGVDMKALEFDPATIMQSKQHYYAIGDQGIFRCSVETSPRQKLIQGKKYGESGDNCVHRNTDLQVTELYDFDVSSTDSDRIIGGTQDTGTVLYSGDASLQWKMVKDGDGLYSLINPYDDDILYGQHQSLDSTMRSPDGGKSWKRRFFHWLPTGYGPGGAWITMNPFVPDGIVTRGTGTVLFHSDNGGSSFNGVYLGDKRGAATRIIVHPSTLDWIVGTRTGEILLVPRDSLKVIPVFKHPQGLVVTSVAVSPADPDILYATFLAGGAQTDKRIYYIDLDDTDPAASIAHNITGNYPANLGPRVIVGDAREPYVAYVGAERGVWRWDLITGGSFKWRSYNDGLPLTTVVDLLIAPDSTLLAATKGRGAWKVITGP